MLRLGAILHLFIGATLSGSGLIAALVVGYDSRGVLVAAALAGFFLSLPVTYWVAKAIYSE
jgi:hypothetical protein